MLDKGVHVSDIILELLLQSFADRPIGGSSILSRRFSILSHCFCLTSTWCTISRPSQHLPIRSLQLFEQPHNAMTVSDEYPAFVYTALGNNEIRLLSPSDGEDGYNWKLQTVNLDAPNLEFDALSYTWGSQKETHPIVCNGQVLHVHHNLYSALPFLAQRGKGKSSGMIWVDAVCINQTDDVEKIVQIKLMNSLYRRAKQVYVWLGCGTPEEQAQMPNAIALLPQIIEEGKRRESLPTSWKTEEVAPPLRNLDPNLWNAIMYLLRNPWYFRVWIVQEAALAADVTFLTGAHEVDAEILKTAIEYDKMASWKATDSNGDPVRFTTSSMDNSTVFWIRELVAERDTSHLKLNTPGLLLRVILLMTRHHACYLPQDRVLGMLGLVREHELATAGIDLHADTSFQTLYTQFTTYLFLNNDPNETQFWWPLFDHAFTLLRCNDLPSWVPDYHHQTREFDHVCTLPRIVDAMPKSRRYQASGTRTTVKVGSRTGSLVLQGRIIDEVVLVHPPIPKRPNVDDNGEAATAWMAQLARWEEDIASKILEYGVENNGTKEDQPVFRRIPEDTYWQTICMHHFEDLASGAKITKEQLHAYRSVMKQVRTWCEWKLEQLERYVSNTLCPNDILRPDQSGCRLRRASTRH